MSKPIILQPRLLQVKTLYTTNPDSGDHPCNVLWFQSNSAGTPTIANLTAMAAAFDAAWGSLCASYMGSGHIYYASQWTDYSTPFGLSYNSASAYGGSGSSATECMPPNVAALISLHIQERWRGGHARIYLPWVSEGMQAPGDPSALTTTAVNNLTTKFAAINVATSGSGVLGGQTQMVYRNKTDAATAHLMPISSFTVSNIFATQRRRLRKAPHH